jgi:hypothetical protein
MMDDVSAIAIQRVDHRLDGGARAFLDSIRGHQPGIRWGRSSGDPVAPTGERFVRAFDPLPGVSPVSLADHREGQCRWPVGEGAPLYCGAAVAGDGQNYCRHHQHLATPRPGSPVMVPVENLRKLERLM